MLYIQLNVIWTKKIGNYRRLKKNTHMNGEKSLPKLNTLASTRGTRYMHQNKKKLRA